MILDHTGNPIDLAAIREPQTARVGAMQREFDNHPSRGLTPARLQSIMVAAEQGARRRLLADLAAPAGKSSEDDLASFVRRRQVQTSELQEKLVSIGLGLVELSRGRRAQARVAVR